jgi:hypothetical protein
MGTALNTAVKLIGLFLIAALASELVVGIISGNPTNSTITLITSVINSAVGGIVSLISNIPIIIVNLVIALLNALLGTNIDYLNYI